MGFNFIPYSIIFKELEDISSNVKHYSCSRAIVHDAMLFFVCFTLGQLILALVKFCDFEIFRFSVYLNLANSWKISELDKMVSEMVFSECDSTCVKLKKSHNLHENSLFCQPLSHLIRY